MTKEEMKALVSSKIEGQGNQVDVGGTLSAILNEIIDGMGGGGGGQEPVILDLGEYSPSYFPVVSKDVTDLIPEGYMPKVTDEIKCFMKDDEEGDYAMVFSGGSITKFPSEDGKTLPFMGWIIGDPNGSRCELSREITESGSIKWNFYYTYGNAPTEES